jgi:hypothetical protein
MECNGCVYYLEGLCIGFEDVVEDAKRRGDETPANAMLVRCGFFNNPNIHLKYEKRVTAELQTLLSTPPKLWISREGRSKYCIFLLSSSDSRSDSNYDTQHTPHPP